MKQDVEYFTVKSSVYARRLFAISLTRLWWVIAIPVLGFFVLACYDSRFLYVAFMWLMIVSPGILAFVYFRFALAPEIAIRVLPHRIIESPEGFTIEYESQPDGRYTTEEEHISKSDITSVEDTASTQLYILRNHPML